MRKCIAANVRHADATVDHTIVTQLMATRAAGLQPALSIQGAVAVNLVGVYLSLGGGWEGRQSANAVDLIPEQTKEEMRARGKYWGFPSKDK